MLVEHIKEALQNRKADRDPSQITISKMGQCLRRTYYDMTGAPATSLDWKAQLIFDDGRVGHDQIRGILRECGADKFRLENEEETVYITYGKMMIVGHIDGVICFGGDHQNDALLEFKTMGDYAFERFEKGEPLDRTYFLQMQAYMRAKGLKRCIYLVKNKNTADLAERVYEYDPKELDDFLPRLAGVGSSVPDREYGFDKYNKLDWHCGYCPYRAHCWDGTPMKEIKRNTYVKPKEV